jgi:membrane protein
VTSFLRFCLAVGHRVFQRIPKHNLPQVAGSLTFTTSLSMVPLLAVGFAVFTAFPVFSHLKDALQGFLFEHLIPAKVSDQIITYVNIFAKKARSLTMPGVIGLLLSGLITLHSIERALNQLWQVPQRRRLGQRILVYWALLTIAPFLMAGSISITSYLVTVSEGYIDHIPIWLSWLISLIPMGLSAGAFAMLYRFLPNVRVRWQDALIGGSVAAIGFELAKMLFARFIATMPNYTVLYGALAVLPLFLIWVYLSWWMLLLGALTAASLPDIRHGYQIRMTSGHTFWDGLAILVLLQRATHHLSSHQPGCSETELGTALFLDTQDLHYLLLRLEDIGWIAPLQTSGSVVRWTLVFDTKQISVIDVATYLGLAPFDFNCIFFDQVLGKTGLYLKNSLFSNWSDLKVSDFL